MPTTDENIESAVVALIQAAIPAVPVRGRKRPGLAETETTPRILVACAYDSEDVGHNEAEHKRNVFYTLYIFIQTRSANRDTGDELINQYRQTISKLLFGPTLAAVPEVDDIAFSSVPSAAMPPQIEGVDTNALGFDVETYEGIT